ncbi:MAG: HAMP domain-containing histidine kinase [Acidobacteriia bacterium]|nr:HAMP domain-containing histidine kinase [Terriglobia bacterium]
MTTLTLNGEQVKFRLLWVGIFIVMVLLASVTYPPNTLPLRSINRVLLMAALWHLLVFFTPLAQLLRGGFDVAAILVDVVFISWIVRITGGFQSEFGLLYFVELILAAVFSERLHLLLGFIFIELGLCSPLLSFQGLGPSSSGSGAVFIRFGFWKAEDLSALGVRTAALVAVYLIGYVGKTLKERGLAQGTNPLTDLPGRGSSPSAKTVPVIESPRMKSTGTASVGEHLSIISHELRSPLTILRAYTDLLKDPHRGTSAEDIVSKIDEEVTELSEMISNLEAIVDERTSPETEALKAVDLVTLLKTQVDRHKSLSALHNFLFQSRRAEVVVQGDRNKLARAFSNLISNSVKYSPEGGYIEVGIDIQERRHLDFFATPPRSINPSQLFAVVRIIDSGIGMSSKSISSAFEKFTRAESERARGIAGTGLGLYLSRRIIEQYQGAIHLESVEGRGTTVTVALPLST